MQAGAARRIPVIVVRPRVDIHQPYQSLSRVAAVRSQLA